MNDYQQRAINWLNNNGFSCLPNGHKYEMCGVTPKGLDDSAEADVHFLDVLERYCSEVGATINKIGNRIVVAHEKYSFDFFTTRSPCHAYGWYIVDQIIEMTANIKCGKNSDLHEKGQRWHGNPTAGFGGYIETKDGKMVVWFDEMGGHFV